jgi:hypothetical protein
VDKFKPRPFITGKRTPVPTEQKPGWAPETVWTLLIRERCFDPSWNRTVDLDNSVGIATGYWLDGPGINDIKSVKLKKISVEVRFLAHD